MPGKKLTASQKREAYLNSQPEPLALREWHEDDKPREKLLKFGANKLTDVELLAILLGTGIQGMNVLELARTILKRFDYRISRVARASVDELCQIKGMGPAKAISILTALELGIRRMNEPNDDLVFNQAEIIANFIRPKVIDALEEQFYVIYTDAANREIVTQHLGTGTSSSVLVDVKKIFAGALKYEAVGIIMVHNHPGESLKPSQSDIIITRKVFEAAKALDMRLIDHVIIGGMDHYSFMDNDRIY